jgi:hypothetical protein
MLIIALFCFIYAANIGWHSLQFADVSNRALKWPATAGHISITRGPRNSANVSYLYSVSGKAYRGKLFDLPRANPFDWSPSRWKNDMNVLVYFDPASPQDSTVNRHLDEKQYYANLICAAVAAVLGAAALAAFLDEMTSHKARLGFR